MLSTKADVKLEIHIMQKIKNRSWLLQTGLVAGKGEGSMGKDTGMASEVMMKKEKRMKRLRMKEESEKGSSEGAMSSYRKRMKRRMEQGSFLVRKICRITSTLAKSTSCCYMGEIILPN